MGLARLAIVATVLAWVAYALVWLFDDLLGRGRSTAVDRAEAVTYLLIVTLLTASTVAYLLCRLGFFYRARGHHRATRAALDEFYEHTRPTLTALVPSYQEEARVIRTTLLSAALQEYPNVHVVLLIDDPPRPRGRRARQLLAAARALPEEIEALLAAPASRFGEALSAFEADPGAEGQVGPQGVTALAGEYDAAVAFLEQLAADWDVLDHAEAFMVNEVLARLAGDLQAVSSALHQAACELASIPRARVLQLYRRLAWTFQAEVSSFERKRYVSLSHEPNKAMNLNSYLGLMGGHYRELQTVAGPALVPTSLDTAELTVADPDYVLTLDADSILLPEYCLRLVYLLEQHEHRQVAIAQTPYSAFPGSATRLERVAGATTDLQHLVHQGLTYYDATFWVGANAIIRKRALDDIAVSSYLEDFEIHTYIRDRTVIEDTESTIELGVHGWQLLNCPERLSYSATPPDFGSLCIQRQRWATGGLLIAARLRHQSRARRARGERIRFGETFLRWNYMASITWSSVCLLVLLAFPFDATLISPLLGLVALPYFWAMASDLRYCGYKRSDVARIYGFNLVLLPVNLAGAIATLIQAVTASKGTFARTPKVRDRTVAPAALLVAPYVLAGLASFTAVYAYEHHRWENLGYAALNLLLLVYAIVSYIGLRNSAVDAWVHLRALLSKPPETPRPTTSPKPAAVVASANWRSVLQLGPDDLSSFRGLQAATLPTVGPTGLPARLPDQDEFRTVFQPVVALRSGVAVGYEALTRFVNALSVEHWLADAATAGVRVALEGRLARAALESGTDLPVGTWLALKAPPWLFEAEPEFRDLLADAGRPVVVEVTQPATTDAVAELRRLAGLLPPNASLALEHAGVDHKSLAALVELRPAYLKLEHAVVSGLGADPARQAQVASMVGVARACGCYVVASGIETDQDHRALCGLGVPLGQGYLLGRPRELARG